MKITESQLRRLVKQAIKEQVDQSGLPRIGDTFMVSDDFVTDQAKIDVGGKGYYQQIRWNQGDAVEIVDIRPSKEFGFTSKVRRAPDVDDKFMRSADQGMPMQAPAGLTDSYKVSFRSLTPKTAQAGVFGEKYLNPDHNPSTAVYEMELNRFLRNFSQQ